MGSIETESPIVPSEAMRHDEITVVVTGFGVSSRSTPSTAGEDPQTQG